MCYSHGISVTYERIPGDVNGPDQRWYYGVWSEDGVEREEFGYTATKSEAAEYVRTCRDSLAWRWGR